MPQDEIDEWEEVKEGDAQTTQFRAQCWSSREGHFQTSTLLRGSVEVGKAAIVWRAEEEGGMIASFPMSDVTSAVRTGGKAMGRELILISALNEWYTFDFGDKSEEDARANGKSFLSAIHVEHKRNVITIGRTSATWTLTVLMQEGHFEVGTWETEHEFGIGGTKEGNADFGTCHLGGRTPGDVAGLGKDTRYRVGSGAEAGSVAIGEGDLLLRCASGRIHTTTAVLREGGTAERAGEAIRRRIEEESETEVTLVILGGDMTNARSLQVRWAEAISKGEDMGMMYASTAEFQANTLWGWAAKALGTTQVGAEKDWMSKWQAPATNTGNDMWLMKGGKTISASEGATGAMAGEWTWGEHVLMPGFRGDGPRTLLCAVRTKLLTLTDDGKTLVDPSDATTPGGSLNWWWMKLGEAAPGKALAGLPLLEVKTAGNRAADRLKQDEKLRASGRAETEKSPQDGGRGNAAETSQETRRQGRETTEETVWVTQVGRSKPGEVEWWHLANGATTPYFDKCLGKQVAGSEVSFQTHKMLAYRPEAVERMLRQQPLSAKVLGGGRMDRTMRLTEGELSDWSKPEMCERAMLMALWSKFSGNDEARAVLMSTGDRTIAEASADSTWGIGLSITEARNGAAWRGRNLLGVGLQKIRAGLRAKEPYSNFRYWDVWIPADKAWAGPLTGSQIIAAGKGDNRKQSPERTIELVTNGMGTPEIRPHVQRHSGRTGRPL